MRQRIILMGCFLACLFSAALVFSQETSKIHGRCLDENDNPLQGAEVLLYYNPFPVDRGEAPKGLGGGIKNRTITNQNGEFELPANLLVYKPQVSNQRNRQVSGYCLLAKHSDRALGICVLEKGKETQPQTIYLNPGRRVRIRVVDEESKEGIPEARVWFHSTGDVNFSVNEDAEAANGVTDKNGECILTNLSVTNCCFFAGKEGYLTASKKIGLGTTETVIHTIKGAAVRGRALFSDDKPAAGLIVKFFKEGDWSDMATYAVTDSEGRWPTMYLPLSYRDWYGPSNLKDDRDKPFSVVADQFLEGSFFLPRTPVLVDTKGKREFDVELKFDRIETGKLFVKFIAPNQQPLNGNKVRAYLPPPEMQGGSYQELGAFTAGEEGTICFDVPLKRIMLMQERKVVIPGWYIPDDYYSLNLSYSEGRWQVDSRYGAPPEALYSFTGGSGTEKDPLVIKVGVTPARTIDGFIVDKEGKPVGNCSIYSGFAQEGAKADSQGKFTFPVLPQGKTIELLAVSSDKKLAGISTVPLESTKAIKITALPTKDYVGKVVDADGMPVGKISLYADPRLDGKDIYRVQEQITTDTGSKFVLHNAHPNCTYVFGWNSDNETNRDFDYGSATVDMSGVTEKKPLTITAKRYIECIMGKVVDKDGKPVKDARITITDWEVMPQNERSRQIVTDENGEFTVGRLAKGKISFQITHPDYKGVCLTGVRTDSVDVIGVLQPKGPLKVTAGVKDGKGRPVAGAKILLLGIDSSKYSRILAGDDIETIKREGTTDRKGLCVIDNLEQGEKNRIQWSLLCDVSGYYSFFCGIPGTMDADFEIVLKKQGEAETMGGKVLDMDGKPIRGAKVKAVYLSSGSYANGVQPGFYYPAGFVTAATDREGVFAFPKISRECQAMLEVQADGYAKKKWYSYMSQKPEKEITIQLSPPCEISGRVLYDDTKKTAEGISVTAQSRTQPDYASCQTDTEGKYQFKTLPAGTYYIRIQPVVPGGMSGLISDPPGYDSIDTEPGKPASGKDFLLKKGISVSGKIIEEKTGKPLVGSYIQCYAKEMTPAGLCGGAQTDQEGKYKISAPPGKIYLLVYTNLGGNSTPQSKEVTLEEGKLYNDVDFMVK